MFAADTGAAKLSIVPIRIFLGETGRAQTATVINGGPDGMDIAVDAYAWSQAPGVPLALSESKDLVVYPRLLHIGPHEQRIVKIGIVDALGSGERAYRLSFTQLPSSDAAAAKAITFRMRVTMPVFVAAAAPKAAPVMTIERATIEPHAIRVLVRNAGAIHDVVPSVSADVSDASGATIGHGETSGWYVLAGAEQTFSIPLAGAALGCDRAAHVNVSVHTDAGETIVNNVVPDQACMH